MIAIISELMDGKLLIGCTLLIATIIKVLVDYWNTTSLERLLMTDMQRFKGNMSNLIFPSIVLAGFGTLFIWLIGEEVPKTKDDTEVVFRVFGLILLGSILLHALLSWVGRFLTLKLEYFIDLNDGHTWKIIRRSNKNTLLLENEDEKNKLIDNWVDKVFTSELKKDFSINNFYEMKRSSIIEWTLIVSSFVLFTTTTVYNDNPLGLLSLLVGAIFFVAFLVIKANKDYYIKLKVKNKNKKECSL